MAYYGEITLRAMIDGGDISIGEAIEIASQVAAGLAKAHDKEIVHRDIKPSNIIVLPSGQIKITDFGIARIEDPDATRRTQLGQILGTPSYMSPEQVRGEPLDARSNLFSVGAVLYEAISGKRAFPGATPADRIAAILHEDPQPLTDANIPDEINALLSRALARDPAQRYPSASAFMKDVQRIGS